MFEITEIRVDAQTENIITDRAKPLFSVKARSDRQNDTATAWQLMVSCDEETVWDSGKREEAFTPHIPYAGAPLRPETDYTVTARLWNTAGETAECQTAFRTGLFGRPWIGEWITHPTFSFGKKENPPAFVFLKHILLRKPVRSAYIYATTLGVYTLQIDGTDVGNDVLAPGYTSYKNQMQYQVYPVTDLLQSRETTEVELCATVAGGWAVATFGPMGTGHHAGKKQAFLMELHITYTDGTAEVIGTDATWLVTADGPVREASIYDGEVIDARVDIHSAAMQRSFVNCTILSKWPTKELTATYGMLPKRIKRLEPVSESKGKKGVIFDFGQNFSGVVSLRLNGKAGQKVTVRHAEVLIDGELFTQPLRTAKARIEYTCKDGVQEYTPQYTYMGFRYVEVSGIDRRDFEIAADVISSITEITGEFSCSNEDVTQLQHNIKWGGLSNFVDIPTNCPQRDERLGWTGDIAVFASTACFNFDMSRFLKKWLKDMRAEQGKHGGIPFVIPNEMFVRIVSAGWGDSCVMVPRALYMDTGDVSILRENYDMVRRYLAQVEKMAHRFSFGEKKYLWAYGFSFGDWLTYGETQLQWMKKRPWVSTAYYANSCGIAARMAGILGKESEKQRYTALRREIINAYRKYFTDGNGTIRNVFQTAYVCPMYFDMVEGQEKVRYAENLVKLVEAADNHLTTGFLGTPYLLFALSDAGCADKAYELLLQDTCPSWLYEVKAGATAIWERWDALRPDGTVNLGEGKVKDISEQNSNLGGGMVSFNHYANGAVGDWLYRRLAGIEATEAGYQTVTIRPIIGGGITWAKCAKATPYGKLAVTWEIKDGLFTIDAAIPFAVTADITTPDGVTRRVGSGEYHYEAQIG